MSFGDREYKYLIFYWLKEDDGQEVEILANSGQFVVKVNEMFNLDGSPIEIAHGGAGNKILKMEGKLERHLKTNV